MTVRSVDVGFVSTDRTLVEFLARVLVLTELEPLTFPQGTVYRLQGPHGLLKVMVPATSPAPPDPPEWFTDRCGLQYVTVRVDDLDGVIQRATHQGGRVTLGPTELRPGVRLAVVADPDGNAIEVIEEAA